MTAGLGLATGLGLRRAAGTRRAHRVPGTGQASGAGRVLGAGLIPGAGRIPGTQRLRAAGGPTGVAVLPAERPRTRRPGPGVGLLALGGRGAEAGGALTLGPGAGPPVPGPLVRGRAWRAPRPRGVPWRRTPRAARGCGGGRGVLGGSRGVLGGSRGVLGGGRGLGGSRGVLGGSRGGVLVGGGGFAGLGAFQPAFQPFQPGQQRLLPGTRRRQQDLRARQLEQQPRRRGAAHLDQSLADDFRRAGQFRLAEPAGLLGHPVQPVGGQVEQPGLARPGHGGQHDQVAEPVQQVGREPPGIVAAFHHPVHRAEHRGAVPGGETRPRPRPAGCRRCSRAGPPSGRSAARLRPRRPATGPGRTASPAPNRRRPGPPAAAPAARS